MDGFDWLQSFLLADAHGYDPNAVHQTHPAFQDAEEVARAAYMHQQAQGSYSSMRSTHPGTSQTLDPSRVYSPGSSGRYRESQHQQDRSVYTQQFNNAPPEQSSYQPDHFDQVNQRPSLSSSSQHSPAAWARQDGDRRSAHQTVQTHMGPAQPPQSSSSSKSIFHEAGPRYHGPNETTRPSAHVEKTNPLGAQPPSSLGSPYQSSSTIPEGHQWQTQSHTSHGMAKPTTQVQKTHTPAAQPSGSQNPSHNHSTTSRQSVQQLPRSIEPHGKQRLPSAQRTHAPVRDSRTIHSLYKSHPVAPNQAKTQPSLSTAAQRTLKDPPPERSHTPVAMTQTHQSPYLNYSSTSAQATQQRSHSAIAERTQPTPPLQSTHTPVPGPSTSQSPPRRHPVVSSQGAQRPDQPQAPPSYHTADAGPYASASPKGFKTSAARSTLEQRESMAPVPRTSKSSNHLTHNSTGNRVRSNPASPGANQVNVQSAVTAAPHRVNSPAISQPASSYSPSVSFVSSAPKPAHSAAPAERANLAHHPAQGWFQEREESRRRGTPGSHQEPQQTTQWPPVSQSNEQITRAIPSTTSSTPPVAVSHPGPSSSSLSWNTETGRRTYAPAQDTVKDKPPRNVPLPGSSYPQTKRWAPPQDPSNDLAPPVKVRRLEDARRQPVAAGNSPSYSSPASELQRARLGMELFRPRGPGKSLKNREDLVQTVQWNNALFKELYDPRTIARDVLIAAGKHPTEKPLNHHLEALRRNFTKIDYYADLATFRWDLVDVKRDPQITHPSTSSAVQLPPSPIAQPLHHKPPSTTRDPAPPNNHMTPRGPPDRVTPRDTPPSRQVAPPTPVRIDARAPPGGLSAWGVLPFKPPTYHSPRRSFPSDLPSGLPRVNPPPASPKLSQPSVRVPSLPPQPRDSPTKSAAPPNPQPPVKRVTPKPASPTKPEGQTIKSQSDSGRIVKTPEARSLQPQVVITPSPDKMPGKRRPGRPPKSLASNIEVAIRHERPVHYQVFSCKWQGCAAELHNIDSVRSHVLKVHIPHSLVCEWTECDNKTPMAAANMFEHIANNHISKMAWELGDGPKVPATALAETNPVHAFGPGDPSARKGTMVLPVDEHQVKAYSKAHGKSSEKAKAESLLEAGRHWKQQIGPEMDWSDRRLSTAARQSRVHCREMAFVGDD